MGRIQRICKHFGSKANLSNFLKRFCSLQDNSLINDPICNFQCKHGKEYQEETSHQFLLKLEEQKKFLGKDEGKNSGIGVNTISG